MTHILKTYIFSFILSISLFACQSNSQKVSARTNKPGNFNINPLKPIPIPLIYDTLSEQTQNIIQQLDKYYNIQVKTGFNGSVLVGYQGRVIYERYFGYANRESRVPLETSSASQLASVSKTFTGAAVLYLNQNKFLDIDEPVQKYINDFPYPNITVKMLLNHRSGLRDYQRWVPGHHTNFSAPINNDEMVEMMIKYKPPLEFKPNTKFKYSNTNYALLAKIVENVTGMSFPEFMKDYFFEPLGMKHTFIYNPSTGLPPFATINYDHFWRRVPDMFADGVYGDKGIYSTVEDMYRWDQSFYQKTILSNDIIEMAYGPCSFEKPGIKNYGLGWRMLCFPNGNKVIYHNGWWHGNNSSFYRFIKDNITIVVLGNKFQKTIYHQAPVVYSIVTGSPIEKGFDTED